MHTGKNLERARPEQVGVEPGGVLRFLDAVERAGLRMHSAMLVRHGKVAMEIYYRPFSREGKQNLYSCSKSFTATAVGFALAEGRFCLDSRVVELLPEKLDGAPHPYVAAMTVEHLLTMATAFSNFVDPVTDDWTREFLNAVPDHPPGTLFGYDTSGTHTLCELLQKTTGQTVLDYLTPRLFEPLGIDDLEWEVSPTGINRGGGGLRMTTESMAKFGLLYLHGGRYRGRQILPEGWARAATSRRIDRSNAAGMHGGGAGYGYQFWCLPDGAFACLGLGGQMIVCLPDRDAVFVATANQLADAGGHYAALDLFWETLGPALRPTPLPADDAQYARLLARCGRARALPAHPSAAAGGQRLRLLAGRRFTAAPNPLGYRGLAFEKAGEAWTLTLEREDGGDAVPFALGEFLPSQTPFQRYICERQYWGRYTFPGEPDPRKRARCETAGVWMDARTLTLHCHLLDTVQSFLLACHLEEAACVLQILPYGVFAYDGLPCALCFESV